jgi:sigma-B regulation protein RsbQ
LTVDILARNHVTITGSGDQTMLFAHGFGCDQRMWRLVAPAFEQDYRVVLFDYTGLGRSDVSRWSPEKYSTLDGYVEDLLDVCDALDLRDAVFVGHSVSAMIGILAARRRPECFSHLVLIGPSPRYIDDPPGYAGGFQREDIEGLLDLMDRNYIGWAQALAGAVMKNPDRPELTEDLADVFCSTDPRVARTFAEATFFADNRGDLDDVQVPALVLQCTDDSIAPDSVGEYVRDHLPKATFRKLQATGHCPQLSHPDETIAAIRAYMDGHG